MSELFLYCVMVYQNSVAIKQVQLKTVCGTAMAVQMAHLHVWLGKLTGRHLCRTVQSVGWV